MDNFLYCLTARGLEPHRAYTVGDRKPMEKRPVAVRRHYSTSRELGPKNKPDDEHKNNDYRPGC